MLGIAARGVGSGQHGVAVSSTPNVDSSAYADVQLSRSERQLRAHINIIDVTQRMSDPRYEYTNSAHIISLLGATPNLRE